MIVSRRVLFTGDGAPSAQSLSPEEATQLKAQVQELERTNESLRALEEAQEELRRSLEKRNRQLQAALDKKAGNEKQAEVAVIDWQSVAASLDERERKVMQLLAQADGKWLSTSDVSSRCGLGNLATEQVLGQLMSKGLLKDLLNMATGRHFRFSDRGRDLAIAQGWAR